jgi:hypothetical protein
VSPPVSGSRKLEFAYDYMSRRVRKQVFTHDGTAWGTTPTSDTRFVYDGWNVLMDLGGLSSNALVAAGQGWAQEGRQ